MTKKDLWEQNSVQVFHFKMFGFPYGMNIEQDTVSSRWIMLENITNCKPKEKVSWRRHGDDHESCQSFASILLNISARRNYLSSKLTKFTSSPCLKAALCLKWEYPRILFHYFLESFNCNQFSNYKTALFLTYFWIPSAKSGNNQILHLRILHLPL